MLKDVMIHLYGTTEQIIDYLKKTYPEDWVRMNAGLVFKHNLNLHIKGLDDNFVMHIDDKFINLDKPKWTIRYGY